MFEVQERVSQREVQELSSESIDRRSSEGGTRVIDGGEAAIGGHWRVSGSGVERVNSVGVVRKNVSASAFQKGDQTVDGRELVGDAQGARWGPCRAGFIA
jgi:hypothetical protein